MYREENIDDDQTARFCGPVRIAERGEGRDFDRKTTAEVTLVQNDHGFSITAVHLKLNGKVPGVAANAFEKLAQGAKANCPVSKVLNADITLEVELTD